MIPRGCVKTISSLVILVFLALFAAFCKQPTAFAVAGEIESLTSAERLHPTYKLPVRCFAYAGNETDTKTWKLPYLLADGRVDVKRLPAAIQAVLMGYRGRKVSGIPDDQVPGVLVRLGRAAAQAGKMPFQDHKAAAVYRQLQAALEKLGRLDEIKARIPKT
jgi:hypothetical protein